MTASLGAAAKTRQLRTLMTSRGPWFDSQDSQRGLQLSKTPLSGDLTPCMDSARSAHTWHTDIHEGKTPISIKNKVKNVKIVFRTDPAARLPKYKGRLGNSA